MSYFAFSCMLDIQCVFLNISLRYAIIHPTVCVDTLVIIILCAGWIERGSFFQVMIFSTNYLLYSIESSSLWWRCVLHNIHLGGDQTLLYASKSKQLVLLFLRGNLCLQRWSIQCEQIYDGKQTSISCWNYLYGLRWILIFCKNTHY